MSLTEEEEDVPSSELLQEYLNLQKKVEMMQLRQSEIKQKFERRLQDTDTKTYADDVGTVKLVERNSNIFLKSRAVEFLTPEQVLECTEKQTSCFVSIISEEARKQRKAFMDGKREGEKKEKEQNDKR